MGSQAKTAHCSAFAPGCRGGKGSGLDWKRCQSRREQTVALPYDRYWFPGGIVL